MKFTPTPNANRNELKDDLQEFGRKLRLMEHFHNKQQHDDISLVKNKSNYIPPQSDDRHLSLFIASLPNIAKVECRTNIKSNISFSQRSALKALSEDQSIVIKEADKGGATVIMDRDYYQHKIEELLSDKEIYTELTNGNEDEKIMRKLKKLTKEHENELTKPETDYIQNFTHKTSNFYGLPKIHKSKEIKDAVQAQNSDYIKLPAPKDLKMRPIVAGPSSTTHRLSNLVDKILKPLCQKVPSYIRDDLDFLTQLPRDIQENALLVSFDTCGQFVYQYFT